MILGARAVAGKLTRGFLSGLSTAYWGRLGVGFRAGLCLGRCANAGRGRWGDDAVADFRGDPKRAYNA